MPAYPVSSTSDSATTAAVMAKAMLLTAVGASRPRSSHMPATSATAAITALRMLGMRNRSRLRRIVEPRSRSWGRNSSTTNRAIIGSDSRKLLVQVQRSAGKYPMT